VPRIIVISDVTGSEPQVLWSERIDAPNLTSQHFRDQLAERIQWAVEDAHHVEHAHGSRSNPTGHREQSRSVVIPAHGIRRARGLLA
jgi:hypothetical protein